MDPYKGILIKTSEILLFYPLNSTIYYQHINNTNIINTIKILYKNQGFYNGIRFQIMYLPINKFIDLQCYKDYCSSLYGGLICSCLKTFTYPIHSFEVYYNLHSCYPKIKNLYNGYSFYFISNTMSYVIWFNCLEFFNKKIEFNENIREKKIKKDFCVGFLSGIIVDILMNPLRVIKTNLQNDYKKTIKNIYKFEDYNIFNPKSIVNRGLKSKLILSALQSSYFNIFINLNLIKNL